MDDDDRSEEEVNDVACANKTTFKHIHAHEYEPSMKAAPKFNTYNDYDAIYLALEKLNSEVSDFTNGMDQVTQTAVNVVGLTSLMTSIADSNGVKDNDDTDKVKSQDKASNYIKKNNEEKKMDSDDDDESSFEKDTFILL